MLFIDKKHIFLKKRIYKRQKEEFDYHGLGETGRHGLEN